MASIFRSGSLWFSKLPPPGMETQRGRCLPRSRTAYAVGVSLLLVCDMTVRTSLRKGRRKERNPEKPWLAPQKSSSPPGLFLLRYLSCTTSRAAWGFQQRSSEAGDCGKSLGSKVFAHHRLLLLNLKQDLQQSAPDNGNSLHFLMMIRYELLHFDWILDSLMLRFASTGLLLHSGHF